MVWVRGIATSPGLDSTRDHPLLDLDERAGVYPFFCFVLARLCVSTAADAASFLSLFPRPGGNGRDDAKR